eukprot:CAMPEP_0174829964 /NCGR_PEP_ID=MMETSP1114-20130205/2256_1 /TAXON_ID=312471 /ORGANISM="Neobodo designis, Strain CCAP 1951/1" /LENGTH=152 /DNA_ID=CAMNT_0016063745 /DNA_START=63 /DNA_END=521 /DNA_ORIENTATION=-
MSHSAHTRAALETHVPSESRLMAPLAESHPEKLYAFESYYLSQLCGQRDKQPNEQLKALFTAEIDATVEKLRSTANELRLETHEKFVKAESGVPLHYNLVRPLSQDWINSLKQSVCKHEVYHLTPQEKVNVQRDVYFFTVNLGAVAFDPDHV